VSVTIFFFFFFFEEGNLQCGVLIFSVLGYTEFTSAEQLAQQKQLLNKRLGLDVAGGLGLIGTGPGGGSDELFKEDLIIKHDNSTTSSQQVCQLVCSVLLVGVFCLRRVSSFCLFCITALSFRFCMCHWDDNFSHIFRYL
jgi:hypothetical protein